MAKRNTRQDNLEADAEIAELTTRLAFLRSWLGWTQSQMAARLGMSLHTYQDLELPRSQRWRDRHSVSILVAICDATGVNTDWLLSGGLRGQPRSPVPLNRNGEPMRPKSRLAT